MLHPSTRRALAFALLLLLAPFAGAQSWSKVTGEFHHVLGSDVAPNGDGLFVAGPQLQRIAPDGSVVYSLDRSPLAAEDVRVRADGRTYVAGYDSSTAASKAYLGALDPTGAPIWERRFEPGDQTDTWFRALRVTGDGGVVAVGSRLFTSSRTALILHRFDDAGNLVWARQIGDLGSDSDRYRGWDVEIFGDGSLLVYGQVGYADGSGFGAVLLHFSPVGSLTWDRHIPVNSSRGDLASMTSGDVLALLPQGGAPSLPSYLRLDSAGNTVWQRSYPIPMADTGGSVRGTADGGAVFLATVNTQGTQSLRVGKLDAAGELEWNRQYGDENLQVPHTLAVAMDGTLWVTGLTLAQFWRVWHLRLDPNGIAGACVGVPRVPLTASANIPLVPLNETELDPGGSIVPVAGSGTGAGLALSDLCILPQIGAQDCSPSVPNSSGLSARIHGVGFELEAVNDLVLVAENLPPAQFGYFLAGQGSAVSIPPGSQGNLCLGGAKIHRYAAWVLSTGATGLFELTLDLTAIPGHGPVAPGETWRFQAWFRDLNPTATSNFTDVVAILFL